MISFIPSWYNPNRIWYSTDSAWFQKNEVRDFDDISTQLRFFQKGAEVIELIVLNYAPNLRRFIHRQNVMQVSYWSVFDEIQAFEHDYVHPINYLELEWAGNVSFHFNPFIVTVMRNTELYARVHLSRDGTLVSIEYYRNGHLAYEHVYDDRGFLSSILMYDQSGGPDKQIYLNKGGDWVFFEFIKTGRIEISPKHKEFFQKSEYGSLDELICERLEAHLEKGGRTDTLVLALDKQHNRMVLDALGKQNLVLSHFKGRVNDKFSELVTAAKARFSDRSQSEDEKAMAEEEPAFQKLRRLSIYPFENRPTFGASANEANLYISFYIDNLSLTEIENVITKIMKQLTENEKTRLLLLTFRASSLDYLKKVKGMVQKYNSLLQSPEKKPEDSLDVEIMKTKETEEKIQIVSINRQTELLQTMAKTRVFIDLGEAINNHLNIEAVSSGVPQINQAENSFCAHKQSGYTVQNMDQIPEALDYFLVGLKNWNESLIFYKQLKDKFTGQQILTRWETMREAILDEDSANRS